MGDNTSDQDTFVSIDNYQCTPQHVGHTAAGVDPDSRDLPNEDSFFPEVRLADNSNGESSRDQRSSSHQTTQTGLHVEDYSAFMWNLYAPESSDRIGNGDEFEDTLEVPGPLDDTPDPSDLCGEFNTPAMTKKSFSRVQNFHSSRDEVGTASQKEDEAYTFQNRHGELAEDSVHRKGLYCDGKPKEPGMSEHTIETEGTQNSDDPNMRTQRNFCNASSNCTEEVFLNATHGIVSSQIENPFISSNGDGSPASVLVMHSTLGPLADDERFFWSGIAERPFSPEALVLKRLVETVQFQQRQVQDLKTAEIQIASAALQSERRRHSEVEQERSVAIETLMEQLSEEGQQRASLEEENVKLRSALSDFQNQNEEVISYFTQFDRDFTFSNGVSTALKAATVNLEESRRRNEQMTREQGQRLEETLALLYQTEKVAEERLRQCEDLERENKQFRSEMSSSFDIPRDSLSKNPSKQIATESKEILLLERDSLKNQLRDLELELGKMKSGLRISRAEQSKVNDALLSMNVELEDAKRRTTALRKQRDSVEKQHRDLVQSAALDRNRFFKFQSEMSANFANAVNEIHTRENDIRRLHAALDDREKAFQIQASTVTHLHEQLQTITNAAIEGSKVKFEGTPETESSAKPVASAVLKSMKDEVAKAHVLLRERSEEVKGLRTDIHKKDELLASVQLECSKLRTAVSVRRMTATNSDDFCVSMKQQQSEFLRRLSDKLCYKPDDAGETFKRLTSKIDHLSDEKAKFEEVRQKLTNEVKHREHALHALRAEMAAELATLKADLRHQETLRVRAQDNCKVLEKKYQELLDSRNSPTRESFGDVTYSSVGNRAWSIVEDSDRDSRRESLYSTVRDEDGVKWRDPIIEEAIRSLNALIGTKDDLWARNRELKQKLESILKSMGVSDEDGKRIRSLIMQSKEFQDELTRIVDMQQDILGNITGSRLESNHVAGADDTLPYLRGEPDAGTSHALAEYSSIKSSRIDDTNTCGEAAQFLREQLNETRTLCNEKLRANVQLCGIINELKQEVKDLVTSNHGLENTVTAIKETHESFVSRLAVMTGAEQSAVAVEDYMRSVMQRSAELDKRLFVCQDRENACKRRITCLIAQKHVLTFIIDIYQSTYKLDLLTSPTANTSLRQRFRRCVISVMALQKLCQLAKHSHTMPLSLDYAIHYDVPAMAPIGRRRVGTIGLFNAAIAVEAMPRLERAVVEKSSEIKNLHESVRNLERSLVVVTKSAASFPQEIPSSFQYKDDVMNRKNDMARRLRDVIQEKELLDDRLSKEKQARIAAEARSTRYLDKVSILKKKLGKTVSNAESKERTYKAAIVYLKNKAEKANDNACDFDENFDPSAQEPSRFSPAVCKTSKRKRSHAESRVVLEQELEKAEKELANLEVGSLEYEKTNRYIKGLSGGIQRLGQPMLSEHSE